MGQLLEMDSVLEQWSRLGASQHRSCVPFFVAISADMPVSVRHGAVAPSSVIPSTHLDCDVKRVWSCGTGI